MSKALETDSVRRAWIDGRQRTHSEGCWAWHAGCVVGILCAEVDDLRATVDRQRKEIARLRGKVAR